MRSVRSQFVMLTVALVVMLQGATLVTIFITANHSVTTQAQAHLDAASIELDNVLEARSERLFAGVRALANDPALRIGASDSDATAVELNRAIDAHDAAFGMLLDRNGSVVTATRSLAPDARSYPQLVLTAGDAGGSTTAIEMDGRIFEVVTVPLPDSRPATWISVAHPVDQSLARELRARIGTDVTLYASDIDAPRAVASSLRLDAEALRSMPAAPGGSAELHYDGQQYLTRTRAPGSITLPLRVVLQQPLDAAMAPYKAQQRVTLVIGLMTLVIGLLCVTTLYRRVARPIERFAAAARRIGAGDYTQRLVAGTSQELAALAAAMNRMQRSIAEREEQVTNQAQFDRLTGLPNRFLIVRKLQESIQRLDSTGVPISVMLVDLNSFRDIVASFGHDIGDALLAQAAERLRATVDTRHTLARLEGDEFLIVMEGIDPAVAWETAEDILRLLGAGLSVRDVNITMDASIGICAFPGDGSEPDELLLHAAVAKNDARETPENINIYQAGQEDRYVRQLAILGDLRRAVREDEFKLYMQPKVRLSDGSVCGAEALARWDHPTLGFLPPQDFISIAERTGNIPLITQWALTTAVRECRLWIEEGLDIPVSVNLTGVDLLDPNLPCFILETLRDHDLDPSYLTLEITEQSLVYDMAHAAIVLQCLRDLGTRIAIDDFGTGHSSLERIKNLPIDELKIDRSFVKELPDNRKDVAIVRATIDLAHNLGMEVIAEGVESRPAMQWLASQGCEKAQGFFISRPMPAETFSQWVNHFSGDVTAYIGVMDAIHS